MCCELRDPCACYYCYDTTKDLQVIRKVWHIYETERRMEKKKEIRKRRMNGWCFPRSCSRFVATFVWLFVGFTHRCYNNTRKFYTVLKYSGVFLRCFAWIFRVKTKRFINEWMKEWNIYRAKRCSSNPIRTSIHTESLAMAMEAIRKTVAMWAWWRRGQKMKAYNQQKKESLKQGKQQIHLTSGPE